MDSIIFNAVTILVTVLILGLLIVIHEFGHFMAARLCGVRVEKFAIGFGPTLWKRKIGETEYSLRLIFLGGYVQMYGDQDPSSSKKDMSLKDHPESFLSKNYFQKVFILSAGVIMNLLLGVVIFVGYLALVGNFVGLQKIGDYPFIGGTEYPNLMYLSEDFREEGAPVGAVLKLNGEVIESREQLVKILSENENIAIDTELYDGQNIKIEKLVLNGDGLASNFDLDVFPVNSDTPYRGVIYNVHQDAGVFFPAVEANGMKVEDFEDVYLISLAGENVYHPDDLNRIVDEHLGQNVEMIMVTTDGEVKSLEMVLPAEREDGKPIFGVDISYSTFGFDDDKFLYQYHDSFTGSFAHTVNTLGYQGYALSILIGDAVNGEPEQLSDNVGGIGKIGGEVGKIVDGAITVDKSIAIELLSLSATISIVLAFMNILPIPVLDGGHILIITIEKMIGRPLPEKVQEWIFMIFFALLVVLSVLVLINDAVDLLNL